MIITIFNKLAALEAANSSCNEYIRSKISSLQTSQENIAHYNVNQIEKTLQEFISKQTLKNSASY